MRSVGKERFLVLVLLAILVVAIVKLNIEKNNALIPPNLELQQMEPQPNDWLFRQRAYPSGSVDHKAYFKALKFREVTIFNSSGMEVKRISSNLLDEGIHEFSFNAAEQPSGIYLCAITSKDGSVNENIKLIEN